MTLRDVGLRAVRVIPHVEPAARWIYSRLPRSWHDTPTSWLENRFGAESEIIFLQLGAFDGVAGDPLRPLVMAHPGWRGALVEPMPEAFARLKANYASVASRLQFINCVVSNRSGSIEMRHIAADELERLGLPAWAHEIASVHEAHISKLFPQARISAYRAPVMRVSEIAAHCGFTKVDLLVLDVEGHERQILDDVDVNGLAIRAIVFEHIHMTEQDLREVLKRIEPSGFCVRRYGRDTIAYR